MVVAGVAHNIEVVWVVACISYVVRVFYMNDLKTIGDLAINPVLQTN